MQDGSSKMSKSAENDASRINLTDTPDVIASKVRPAAAPAAARSAAGALLLLACSAACASTALSTQLSLPAPSSPLTRLLNARPCRMSLSPAAPAPAPRCASDQALQDGQRAQPGVGQPGAARGDQPAHALPAQHRQDQGAVGGGCAHPSTLLSALCLSQTCLHPCARLLLAFTPAPTRAAPGRLSSHHTAPTAQAEVLADVAGLNWGAFKPLLADALIAHLEPIQGRYNAIMADPSHVDEVLGRGAEAAAATANATLAAVKDAMGFVLPARTY